jgi:hypothetical protein
MTWTESKKESLAHLIVEGMDLDGVIELAYSHVLRHLDTLDPEELSIEAENFDLV